MYNVGDGYKGTDGTIPSTSLYAWNLSLQNVRGKKIIKLSSLLKYLMQSN